ncbi:MAG: LPP20 family lipoprotein [Pontiellaceae bacterium]|nr:LPP20 family lipoprotein [Pontiellaceae bacterium]MBN2786507.1 LPP20 family lipoprotein [Pontiellaceae bacterium]
MHTKRYRSILPTCAALCMVSLAGCLTLSRQAPDWVNNPKSLYPEKQFLVALGEGDTRQSAENAAAANLSRIFESHIQSDERVVDRVVESEVDFIRNTDLTTDINIQSSQTLINIQHAEAWKDETGRYHAVAYLNRRETAQIYREQIEETTQQIEKLLNETTGTGNALRQYALFRSSLRYARENDILLRQLKIIHSSSASASAPSYSLKEIENATAESAHRIHVSIQLSGDPDGKMTNSVKQLITRYGFVVGSPADLILTGAVSLEDTGKRVDGLAFFRYNLAIQIADAQNAVLVSINDTGREAVTDPAEAPVRCHRTMERTLKSAGVNSLDAYFDKLAHSD